MVTFTPKQRMLNAYRGVPSDRAPVAPEFWYYYPARLLGVDMIAFEREVPFWQALKTAFEHFSCEGWGAAFGEMTLEGSRTTISETPRDQGRFRQTTTVRWRGREFTSSRIYDRAEPSSVESPPVGKLEELEPYLDMFLSEDAHVDLAPACAAHAGVGESYLLEYWLGMPFFDWIGDAAGFEPAVVWATSVSELQRDRLRERYLASMIALLRRAARETRFESFVIGCSASCNSLLGPALWRTLDKPLLAAVAREAHALGKLLHIHFHGRSIQTIADFVDVRVDCVCPFERPPGGDVQGIEGLRAVRTGLKEKVTFNGNVHTVETLIRGTPSDVRREVREIREAFGGSARCIIGTGDQVGRETPEENIAAMIDEGKRG